MIFACCFIALYLIIVGIPVLTFCRLVRNPTIAVQLTSLLARMVMFLAGIRVRVKGADLLSKGTGYVFASNHRSFVDGAVAFGLFPGDLRFLIKKEAFKIPLVSFAFKTMGMIEVDRSNAEASAMSIERAVLQLKAGKSVVLFPEGTRNREPGLKVFKKGAFVLAIKAGCPVVPVTMLHTDEALQPDTILLYPTVVEVIIHSPIPTTDLSLDDRNDLLAKVRAIIEETYRRGVQTAV